MRGAELLHIFRCRFRTHGLALNITVQSYRDQLDSASSRRQHHSPCPASLRHAGGEFAALEAAFAPPADLKSVAS